jgi:hypothetical protein
VGLLVLSDRSIRTNNPPLNRAKESNMNNHKKALEELLKALGFDPKTKNPIELTKEAISLLSSVSNVKKQAS